MNDLIKKEINGIIHYTTLSIFKRIGTSSHYKLKTKATKLNLEILEDKELGSMLSHAALQVLLEAYQKTLKGQSLFQVEQLLGQLGAPKEQPSRHLEQSGAPTEQKPEQSEQPSAPQVQSLGQLGAPQEQKSEQLEQSSALQEQPVEQQQAQSINNQGTRSVHPLCTASVPSTYTHQKDVTSTERILTELSYFLSLISTFIKTEQFLMVVLVSAICIQINHIANLFYHTSSHPNWSTWLGAYLFGTVSELTALLLTIHQGQPKTLKAFAWLTFWVNLLYYQVWVDFDGTLVWWMSLTVKVTLSGLIAYVIYSYAHLFAIGEQEEPKTNYDK